MLKRKCQTEDPDARGRYHHHILAARRKTWHEEDKTFLGERHWLTTTEEGFALQSAYDNV